MNSSELVPDSEQQALTAAAQRRRHVPDEPQPPKLLPSAYLIARRHALRQVEGTAADDSRTCRWKPHGGCSKDGE